MLAGKSKARELCALEAVKMLYQHGALDNHLLSSALPLPADRAQNMQLAEHIMNRGLCYGCYCTRAQFVHVCVRVYVRVCMRA